ncbi:DUF533 domain-containing protein [Tropicimonas aquimaris]|uniref:DUF533 domain-containing protein n=1 Tax=Tropicimonas aquimaris TaxID=914152 RepID=A0ABW3ISF5_9RHOB
MSLVKTLAKVAAGVVVANSVKNMMDGGAGGRTLPRTGRVGQASSGSGLEDILGRVLGGGGLSRGSGGGLGGSGAGPGGSLQDMLGQFLGGRAGGAGRAGSMGEMLEQLSQLSRPGGGSGGMDRQTGGQGGFGRRLDEALNQYGEPQTPTTDDEEHLAGVLLRAMIQAAKADGRIDPKEKTALLGRLGDVSREEEAFVERELNGPVDVRGLAADIPRGAEQQFYMVSVMAKELDDQSEAKYLHELAQTLNLDPATVNAIHDRLGAPHIYR